MFDKQQYMKEYNKKYFLEHPDYSREWKRKRVEIRPEYGVWEKMHRRCNSKSAHNYKWYGGRGIKCLYSSYEEFINDVGPRPNRAYTIDRIDNDRHYEIGNCRWATAKEQANNRRTPEK